MATAYDDLAFVAPRGAPASSAELYCKDCDEVATQTTPDRKRCLICGCELEDRAAASRQRSAEGSSADPVNASERDIERLMQLLVESLGGDGFGGANDARRPAAESAVANLGSFTADQASTIEVAVAVSGISGEVVAVPANFGPCESLPRAQVCVADPLDGSQPFRNAEALKDKIVVMERGTCTFAQKVVRAQAAGAAGVIIIQTFDVWPYTMTDSKGESASLTIPAFMLSMKQGKRFLEYLREHCGETAPSAEITVRKNERECVICQVEMTIGAKLTRMPCQHMFHTDCLHQWLKIGNSCPICRVEIPSKNGPSSSAPTAAQEQQRAATWGAWFS